MPKCLCEKEATQTAWVLSSMWSGVHQMKEAHSVCDYHAARARRMGLEVVPLPEERKPFRRHQVREWTGA
jgi:hypothetical protein